MLGASAIVTSASTQRAALQELNLADQLCRAEEEQMEDAETLVSESESEGTDPGGVTGGSAPTGVLGVKKGRFGGCWITLD